MLAHSHPAWADHQQWYLQQTQNWEAGHWMKGWEALHIYAVPHLLGRHHLAE